MVAHALRKQRQMGLWDKASLVYRVNCRTAWATERNSDFKNNNNNKKHIACFQHNSTFITIPKGKKGAYWGNTGPKSSPEPGQTPNSAIPCLTSKHSSDRQLLLFDLLTATTLLSLGLVPDLLCSFPWHISHNSGISDILGSPVKSRLYHHSLSNGLHRPPCRHTRHTPDTCLGDFLGHGRRLHNLFIVSLTLKTEPFGLKLPNSAAWWGLESGTVEWHLHQLCGVRFPS